MLCGGDCGNREINLPETKITAWDGYITLEPSDREIVVTIDGVEVARSRDALRLQESDYSAVYYIPRVDINETHLVPSGLRTQCKWKGEAQYLSYQNGDVTLDNVVWMYPDALDPVAPIRTLVSFAVGKVEISEI